MELFAHMNNLWQKPLGIPGRKLCGSDCETHCQPGDRHCEGAQERNVFSRADGVNFEFPEIDLTEQTSHEFTEAPSPLPTQWSGNDASVDSSREEYLRLPECQVDEQGNFGPSSVTNRQEVRYLYQVQTTMEQSVNSLNEVVLKDLETRMSELLLLHMLEGVVCRVKETNFRVGSRLLQGVGSDESGIVGISSAPIDEVRPGLEGIQCRNQFVGGARRCFIVGGGFTFLGEDNADIRWTVSAGLTAAKILMDDGNLNNVHPDVIDVRFVGRLDETGIPSEVDGGSNVLIPPDGPAKNNSHSSSNQVRAWPWSLLALGITTICVCIYLYRNRRRNQLDDNSFREDATNAPRDTDNIKEPTLPYLVENSDNSQHVTHPGRTENSGVASKRYYDDAAFNGAFPAESDDEFLHRPFTDESDDDMDVSFPSSIVV